MSSKAKKTILIAVAAVCILVCVGSGLFLYQYYHGVQVESTLLERMKTGTAEISSRSVRPAGAAGAGLRRNAGGI